MLKSFIKSLNSKSIKAGVVALTILASSGFTAVSIAGATEFTPTTPSSSFSGKTGVIFKLVAWNSSSSANDTVFRYDFKKNDLVQVTGLLSDEVFGAEASSLDGKYLLYRDLGGTMRAKGLGGNTDINYGVSRFNTDNCGNSNKFDTPIIANNGRVLLANKTYNCGDNSIVEGTVVQVDKYGVSTSIYPQVKDVDAIYDRKGDILLYGSNDGDLTTYVSAPSSSSASLSVNITSSHPPLLSPDGLTAYYIWDNQLHKTQTSKASPDSVVTPTALNSVSYGTALQDLSGDKVLAIEQNGSQSELVVYEGGRRTYLASVGDNQYTGAYGTKFIQHGARFVNETSVIYSYANVGASEFAIRRVNLDRTAPSQTTLYTTTSTFTSGINAAHMLSPSWRQ